MSLHVYSGHDLKLDAGHSLLLGCYFIYNGVALKKRDNIDMVDKLKKMYWQVYGPLVALILLIFLLVHFQVINIAISNNQRIGSAVIIGTAFLAFVAPMWQKVFHLKNNVGKPFDETVLFKYLRNMFFTSACAFAVIPVTFLLGLKGPPLIMVIFLALFASFYNFPSKRKWEYEKKLLTFKKK